jgi:hypothetical protein
MVHDHLHGLPDPAGREAARGHGRRSQDGRAMAKGLTTKTIAGADRGDGARSSSRGRTRRARSRAERSCGTRASPSAWTSWARRACRTRRPTRTSDKYLDLDHQPARARHRAGPRSPGPRARPPRRGPADERLDQDLARSAPSTTRSTPRGRSAMMLAAGADPRGRARPGRVHQHRHRAARLQGPDARPVVRGVRGGGLPRGHRDAGVPQDRATRTRGAWPSGRSGRAGCSPSGS